jgi:hypothetical protein
MNRKWLIVVIVALLGGMLLVVCFDRPPALPALAILPPTPLAVKSGRVPDRWIPAKWTWLRRACLFVLGAPRQVGYDIQFIQDSETVASILAENSLGPPQAESNGVAIWILPGETLKQPNGASTTTIGSRILTTDQMSGKVFGFGSTGGHTVEFFARLEKGTIDLSTCLTLPSAAQSNSFVAVRAQLPYGHALFLLDVRQPESASNRLEFLITADEYDAKGSKVHGKAAGR